MRVRILLASIVATLLVCPAPSPAVAASAPASSADSGIHLQPFPADAHVSQSVRADGRTIKYTVTVGSLPIRDDKGKTIAQVMYTAYTVPGHDRPVTFAMNGGPGASSVYLNLGAIGPKTLSYGADGDNPSDPPVLHDNPGTWLDFTDLVFIDPVGTGYSRALVPDKQAKQDFYTVDSDIHYLSGFIYDWLSQNGRMTSRKYLVGESYGGFRGPRIAEYLQTRMGIGLNGVVLVSPFLTPAGDASQWASPLPWMMSLPSITAAHLESEGKLTDQAMQKVINYTLGDYAHALLLGNSAPALRERMIKRVTAMTGLDPTFVRQSGGRLDVMASVREMHRSQGKLGSAYDPNLTGWDPFPFAPTQQSGDPLLNKSLATTTEAMVNFITRTVGWKYAGRYHTLNYKVNSLWTWVKENGDEPSSVKQLREIVASDSKMHVLIAHGWNDLACPFMASLLVVNQMPKMGGRDRVELREYPGGHMFYERPASRAAFHKDVKAMYQAH